MRHGRLELRGGLRGRPALAGLMLLLGVGCTHGEGPRSELVVFAAASLTEVFQDLAMAYEQRFPETRVVLNLAGSQTLRLQIEQGTTPEVFASANVAHMEALARAGYLEGHELFAANELVLAVPRSSASAPRSFSELPLARRIVLGDSTAPIGNYTDALIARAASRFGELFSARVARQVVSRESNVRLVLAKVELAEADAAIVYRSDVVGSARVRALEIPASLVERPVYAIGRLRGAPRPDLAEAWLGLLRGPVGRDILRRRAFSALPAD